MGAPIEQLYQLTPRDQAGVQWSPYFDHQTLTIAAATPRLSQETARADVLIFATRVLFEGNPPAGIGVDRLRIFVIDQSAANNTLAKIADQAFPGTFALVETLALDLDLALVGGNHRLSGICNFTGSNAANAMVLDVVGFRVPRGNVALF